MNKVIPLLTIAALLATSGCATVARGSKDVLVVQSVPAGAQVSTSNGLSCDATPCLFELARRSELVVNFTKDGCAPMAITVTHKTAETGAAGVAGNILVGGIIGLGVDAATGASQDLDPNPVIAQLNCWR
ncbi:MAG: translation initiation factor 2 [Aliishimia sp.]